MHPLWILEDCGIQVFHKHWDLFFGKLLKNIYIIYFSMSLIYVNRVEQSNLLYILCIFNYALHNFTFMYLVSLLFS